jgi:hypothetical protein
MGYSIGILLTIHHNLQNATTCFQVQFFFLYKEHEQIFHIQQFMAWVGFLSKKCFLCVVCHLPLWATS